MHKYHLSSSVGIALFQGFKNPFLIFILNIFQVFYWLVFKPQYTYTCTHTDMYAHMQIFCVIRWVPKHDLVITEESFFQILYFGFLILIIDANIKSNRNHLFSFINDVLRWHKVPYVPMKTGKLNKILLEF